MTSSYQKILKKITDTEKRLKPNKQDISELMELELNEKAYLINSEDVVEEYKSLKENINVASMGSFSLAYQPVKVKTRRWSTQDF